ncbi:hypothetical protein BZU93_29590, partial [Salmonella enterica subsp. enterica]|nr:hypothetical protein [Salmonella enterica subsp. enterica serovar Enteritidis]
GFSRQNEEPNGETLWAFEVDTYEGVDLPLKLDLDGAASDSRPVPSAAPVKPIRTLNEAMRALSRARTTGKLEAVQDAIAQSIDSIAIPYDVQSLGPKFSTDREFRQDYFSVRYGGAPKVEAFSDYRALSENLARRIVVPEWVENKLFHLRPDKEQSLDDWREQIRRAAASEQVARDVILTGVDLSDYFHPDAPAVLERLYNLPNPAIVLTSHFGHRLARSYLTRMTRGKMFVLNMKGKDANYTWSNPVEAAMVAMRALGEGRKVFVAPDGPRGTDRADIDVSGYKLDVAHGIHTIGYDCRANIAWLHVEVHPEGFLPVLDESGPSYEQGDTKRSYAARVDKYYAGRIESVLEGDPAQLLVLPGHEYRLRTK